MTIRKWSLLDSRIVFSDHWYTLRRDRVRLPDGTDVDDYFVSVRPDVAVVFPLTAAGDVIFVRQYKHGVQDITLELPAGTFRDEDPAEAARRELAEETGYGASELVSLGWVYEDPTRNTNRIHLFLGLGCVQDARQNLQELEASAGIEVVSMPLESVMGFVRDGHIRAMSAYVTMFRAFDELALRGMLKK